MPRARKRHLLIVTLIVLAIVSGYPFAREVWRRFGQVAGTPSSAPEAMAGRALPSLESLSAWIGGRPAAPAAGTPVAIVVFSATDPRALEALADAEAWHDAYAARGVRVVGLHRPEFAFAADTAWLAHTLARLGVSFPVAHDPGLAVRLPYTLPRVCVLVGDAGGAAFAAAEARERHAADRWLRARSGGSKAELPAALDPPRPDPLRLMRLGAGQVESGPLARATPGEAATFVTQTRIEEESRRWVPVPVGRWTSLGDGLQAARGGAANFVAIRYHAARVGVVASPPPGKTARLWVLSDDAWVPAGSRGRDLRTDSEGATYLEISEPRLLIAIERDPGWHVLRVSPEVPGVVLHALTFDRPWQPATGR